jgi:hypothetical protein
MRQMSPASYSTCTSILYCTYILFPVPSPARWPKAVKTRYRRNQAHGGYNGWGGGCERVLGWVSNWCNLGTLDYSEGYSLPSAEWVCRTLGFSTLGALSTHKRARTCMHTSPLPDPVTVFTGLNGPVLPSTLPQKPARLWIISNCTVIGMQLMQPNRLRIFS